MNSMNSMNTQPTPRGRHAALGERKAQLLRQGNFYRLGIVHARAVLVHATRPEALLRSALEHAGWALRARLNTLSHPGGGKLAAMAPFAYAVLDLIGRRGLIKPALGAAGALGALAWYLRRRAHRRS